MNAYPFVYDRRIARPEASRPFVRGAAILIPLLRLDRDLVGAELLPGSRGIARIALENHRDGTGELVLAPSGAMRGRYGFTLAARYTDGIQHVDDKLDGEVFAAAELAIRFTEHGTVRVDLPVPLAVTPALTDPSAYAITAFDGGAPMHIRSVGREERRPDAAGRVRGIDDPTYLEFFVSTAAIGVFRLDLPLLRTREGGAFGPASGLFSARLVKRGFAERTLGPRSAHAHELAPGVVVSALFAEDERAAGRGEAHE
jgi:hypothetical protein